MDIRYEYVHLMENAQNAVGLFFKRDFVFEEIGVRNTTDSYIS